MAPPTSVYPVSELPERAQYHTVNFKEKRRKVRDFDLETCELFELVQYSCTSMKQQLETGNRRMECRPFVRLFRRCGRGEKMFHVETTAWEGEHAYDVPAAIASPSPPQIKQDVPASTSKDSDGVSKRFAEYSDLFWSKK